MQAAVAHVQRVHVPPVAGMEAQQVRLALSLGAQGLHQIDASRVSHDISRGQARAQRASHGISLMR